MVPTLIETAGIARRVGLPATDRVRQANLDTNDRRTYPRGLSHLRPAQWRLDASTGAPETGAANGVLEHAERAREWHGQRPGHRTTLGQVNPR